MAVVGDKVKKCPQCGSEDLVYDKSRGEIVCKECGTVIQESMVDRGQEWRAFDAEQRKKRARTGPPRTVTRHDKGLSTSIGKGYGEIYKVPSKKRAQYYRLKKWHKRLIDSKDRNLSFALSELQRMVSSLNLPKPVHERVARYYEQALEKGLIRGRSIESVVAGLVYAVSKKMGTPRTIEEIASVSGRDKTDISRTYRYVARQLGIRILPADPKDYVPRFCSILGLSGKTQAKAIQILEKGKEKSVTSGKAPTGVAAAAIYIAATLNDEEITQREIANALYVTEVTIRNRQKEFEKKLKIEEKKGQ